MLCRACDESLPGNLSPEAMNQPCFGDDNEALGLGLLAVGDHFFRAADSIGHVEDSFWAFGVGDDRRVRKLHAELLEALRAEEDVNVAAAWPKLHRAACLFGDPAA